jgi:WD40 repeat protein
MPEFSRNLAFVIGINKYSNGISALQNAVNDAKKLVEALRGQHEYRIWVCLDEVATLGNLSELLDKTLPEQVKPDDRLLFYFAGHGIALNNEDGPEGYLIPQDAKLGDVQTYLPMTRLQVALEKLPCRHFLGILDCCFAGAFRWSSTRDFSTVPEVIYQERYDRFTTDPAWQIITSTAYDQKALDAFAINTERGQGTHSPFAAALLEALAGKADVYPAAANGQPAGDGVITATELYLYLRDRVEPATVGHRQRQTPGIWPLKKHDKGEYIFLTPGHVLNLPPAPPLNESQNPYRGLEAFEESQSDLFFGRQTLTEKLHEFVSQQPLTVVLGASGTGKSSLVKAGLIPYLKQLDASNQQQWHILAIIRPGESPLKTLNNTLARANLAKLNNQEVDILSANIAAWSQQHPNAKLLLVIDQLEEIITLCRDEQEREKFLNLLAQLITKSANYLRLLLTLRFDFESQFQDTALKQHWKNARFIVPQMTRIELRQAIEEPASKRVMYFKSDDPQSPLVDRLIDEVADMPGALPLLSFTLSELYLKYLKRQKIAQINGETIDRAITEADYQELGGVARSLTQRADNEYEQLVQLDSAYAQTIRHVMLRMVAVGGGELARRRVPLSELEYPLAENQRVKEIIRRFTDARLLVEGQDTEGNPYIEPAHDALVRGWQKLLAWKQDEEENLILQRRLTPAAFEWQSVKNQQQPSGVSAKTQRIIDWLDGRLYTVEHFLNKISTLFVRQWQQRQNQQANSREKPVQFLWSTNPYLDVLNRELQWNYHWFNQVEAEFVQQSVLQKRRNISWLWRIVIAVILGLSGLTIAALISQRRAKIGEASASRETAEARLNERGLDPLIYSLRAGKTLQDPLLQLFPSSEQLQNQVRGTLQEAVYSVRERVRMERHKGTVRSFLSPDNQLLASAGDDDTIRIWDLKGRLVREWQAQQGIVNNLAFSPDGKLIATAGRDDTVRIWDLQGRSVEKWQAQQGFVKNLSFSSNGQLLATGGANNTVRLWNLQGNPVGQPFRRIAPQKQEQKLVWSVAFSPDDKIIASAGDDGFISLWNLQGRLLREWQGNQGDISSIKFSPDGQQLVTGGEDSTVRLWNLQGQQLGKPLRGHQGRVWDVEFSHNGQQVASVAGDGSTRVWNLQGKELDKFIGHQGPVRSVSISKDNQLIVSAGDDGIVHVWNLNDDQQIQFMQHQYTVRSVSFSLDGQRLASAGDDGTVRLWNLQGQELAQPFLGHRGTVFSVSFSPDGQRLASAGEDGTIRLWNLQGQQLVQPFVGHQGTVNSVSFSPDGQFLASAGADGTVRLWNLQGQPNPQIFPGHRGKVNSVSFSPDGRRLASAGNDATVRLWNLQGQELAQPFLGHLGPVYAIAFSSDGKQIASAGDDGTVRLWDLKGQPTHQPFQVSGIKLKAVAFSPNGKMIAASGEKGTVQLWNLQGEKFATWIGHQGFEIENVSFSPDGKLLATAGADGIAGLWHIESFNELIQGACDRLHDYLNNSINQGDRYMCQS